MLESTTSVAPLLRPETDAPSWQLFLVVIVAELLPFLFGYSIGFTSPTFADCDGSAANAVGSPLIAIGVLCGCDYVLSMYRHASVLSMHRHAPLCAAVCVVCCCNEQDFISTTYVPSHFLGFSFFELETPLLGIGDPHHRNTFALPKSVARPNDKG